MTTLRTAAQQALEALQWHYRQGHSNTLGGFRLKIDEKALRELSAALAQRDEPDHETRAELAEQQVVQLAEERDHYRNLWQKAQQDEPLNLADPAVQKRLATQWGYAPAAQAEPVEPVEPVAWYRPSIAPDYYAPVFVEGAQPPAPLTQAEARLLGWRPLVPPKAEPVEEPAYKVKVAGRWHEAEPLAAAFNLPDGEHLLYTAPPQRKPLPKHEQHCVDVPGYGLTAVRLVRAVERAHGIKE